MSLQRASLLSAAALIVLPIAAIPVILPSPAIGLSPNPAPATVVLTINSPVSLTGAQVTLRRPNGRAIPSACAVTKLRAGQTRVTSRCRVPAGRVVVDATHTVRGTSVYAAPPQTISARPGATTKARVRFAEVPGLKVVANAGDAWAEAKRTSTGYPGSGALSYDGSRVVAKLATGRAVGPVHGPKSVRYKVRWPVRLRVIDAHSGAPVPGLESLVMRVQYWPDGELGFTEDGSRFFGEGQLYDATTGALVERPNTCVLAKFAAPDGRFVCDSGTFSAEGKRLKYGYSVWDPATGAMATIEAGDSLGELMRSDGFFGNNELLVDGQRICGRYLLDTAEGWRVNHRAPDCDGDTQGRFIAYRATGLSNQDQLMVFDATTSESRLVAKEGEIGDFRIDHISADGRRLVLYLGGKGAWRPHVLDLTTDTIQALPLPAGKELSVNSISGDGETVLAKVPLVGGGSRNQGDWLVTYRLTDDWQPLL